MKKNNTLVICFLIAILIAIIHGMPDTKSKSSNFNSNKPNINMSNPAEYMSQMDGHSQEQFQSLLNVIHNYYPEMKKEDLGFYICGIWNKTKETLPDISLYDYTVGFKDFLRDSGGGKDFGETLCLYSAFKNIGY